jgi:hypothetical protein
MCGDKSKILHIRTTNLKILQAVTLKKMFILVLLEFRQKLVESNLRVFNTIQPVVLYQYNTIIVRL